MRASAHKPFHGALPNARPGSGKTGVAQRDTGVTRPPRLPPAEDTLTMPTVTHPAKPARIRRKLTLDVDLALFAVITQTAVRLNVSREVAARALILNSLHAFSHTVGESNAYEMIELIENHADDESLPAAWLGWASKHLGQ